MDRCSLREAVLKLASARAEPIALTTAPACPKQLVTKRIKSSSPLGFTLRGVDTAHPYLAARGIEARAAVQFGVGFYGGSRIFAGRLVIPIHNERGELVAYCGRALDGTQPRYRFPPGFAKSEFVFSLHRAAAAGQQSAVVVEGFYDCLKVHQAGVLAAVALMGAALYEAQKSALLRHFRSLILMLDGDSDTAGRHATAAIAAQLQPYATVRVLHLPDGVQPDQLTAEAAREILQACSLEPGTGVPMPAAPVTEREDTERRILLTFVRHGFPTQPASSVRGSSRRIMTMRFRPADIRVINRRKMPLVPSPALRLLAPDQASEGVENGNG